MKVMVVRFSRRDLGYWELMDSFVGWQAHASWGNSFLLRKNVLREIAKAKGL